MDALFADVVGASAKANAKAAPASPTSVSVRLNIA
jgi:hypothetical protein